MITLVQLAWVATFALVAGAMGCVPSYVVVPRTGGTSARASNAELVVEAVPNAWNDDPVDLDSYVTPIWIRLTNRGKADVRLVYVDFTLTDSSGKTFDVMSPYSKEDKLSENFARRVGFESVRLASRVAAVDTLRPASRVAPGMEVESASFSGVQSATSGEATSVRTDSDWYFAMPGTDPERAQLAPLGDGTASVELVRHIDRPVGRMGGRGYMGPSFGPVYYGPPHRWGYYGYYNSWPYYGPYGPYYWGPTRYYWVERYPLLPTEAMKQHGAREGVLRAGASVSGFLYFRQAATQETNLDLRWAPRRLDGKQLATVIVPLKVVED